MENLCVNNNGRELSKVFMKTKMKCLEVTRRTKANVLFYVDVGCGTASQLSAPLLSHSWCLE